MDKSLEGPGKKKRSNEGFGIRGRRGCRNGDQGLLRKEMRGRKGAPPGNGP